MFRAKSDALFQVLANCCFPPVVPGRVRRITTRRNSIQTWDSRYNDINTRDKKVNEKQRIACFLNNVPLSHGHAGVLSAIAAAEVSAGVYSRVRDRKVPGRIYLQYVPVFGMP